MAYPVFTPLPDQVKLRAVRWRRIASACACVLGCVLGCATTGAAQSGSLTFQVTNVRNSRGHVHIDICPEGRFLKDDCPYSGEAPAHGGTTIVTVTGVPPGRYAAQAFHDENDNHKVDRVLFGVPREGVGFSNDARIGLGPPKFADAAFINDGTGQSLTLRIRYFLGPSGPPRVH